MHNPLFVFFFFPYLCVIFHFFFDQDMWLYVSEHEKFNDFGNEQALIWHERNIPFAVWGPQSTRSLSLKYYPSEVSLAVGCAKSILTVSSLYLYINRDIEQCVIISLFLLLLISCFLLNHAFDKLISQKVYFFFPGFETQWESICSRFLCTLWLHTRPK